MMKAAYLLLLAFVLGSATSTAAARDRARAVDRGQLPAGFAIGDGSQPLGLVVARDGQSLTSTVAVDPAAATVVLTRSSGDDGTMISVKSSMDLMVKYDLYISPDGKRFVYTSTCPLVAGGSGFEMWPHPIHSFAIGNPRVVAEDAMVCE